MRIARKLAQLALAGIATMALGASTASAQTVEVINEATGTHCPALGAFSGGCAFHFRGELGFRGHVFGIESTVSDCNVEFTGGLNEDGEGKIYSASLTDHGGVNDCVRVICNSGFSRLPWHADLTEGGGLTETFSFEFCLDPDDPAWPDGDENICFVSASYDDLFGGHRHQLAFNDVGTSHQGIDCEVLGTLSSTIFGDDLEVVHTP